MGSVIISICIFLTFLYIESKIEARPGRADRFKVSSTGVYPDAISRLIQHYLNHDDFDFSWEVLTNNHFSGIMKFKEGFYEFTVRFDWSSNMVLVETPIETYLLDLNAATEQRKGFWYDLMWYYVEEGNVGWTKKVVSTADIYEIRQGETVVSF